MNHASETRAKIKIAPTLNPSNSNCKKYINYKITINKLLHAVKINYNKENFEYIKKIKTAMGTIKHY